MRKGLLAAVPILVLVLLALSTIGGVRFYGEKESAIAILVATVTLALFFVTGNLVAPALKTFHARIVFWLLYSIAAIVVIATAAGYSARRYLTEDYVVEESHSVNQVLDTEGRSGHFRKLDHMKVIRDSPTVFWERGLGATGEIRNIVVRFENLDIKSQEIQPRAGIFEVRTELLHPLRPGATLIKVVELDVVGSQPEDKVYSIMNVTRPIRKLVTEIRVPAARPCKSATATSSLRGQDERKEGQPEFSEDRTIIRWSKLNPEKGHEYVVTCNW